MLCAQTSDVDMTIRICILQAAGKLNNLVDRIMSIQHNPGNLNMYL